MNGSNPAAFSSRVVLGMVLFGALVFIALLWMIGSGMTSGDTNNGGAHVGGKGLNGYAAMANFLEKRGHPVRRSHTEAALDDPGLLVLTPSPMQDGKELHRIVEARRWIGPTLVILPKWLAMQPPAQTKGAKPGWVKLLGTQPPRWEGFLDDVEVDIGPLTGSGAGSGTGAGWQSIDQAGRLPDVSTVMTGKGPRLVPLVTGGEQGRFLAAYVNDGGMYPALEAAAVTEHDEYGDEEMYPLVLVFEPDLLNNYGMGKADNAWLVEDLVHAASEDADTEEVIFDLTQSGFARSANLLTLAFKPPYLAATLCLIMAALVVGWRAFLRFGPAVQAGRGIAFGKAALVGNAAGLIRRAGRLHLIASPYADAARERLARALALPRMKDAAATEAAIDRALAARRAGAEPFSSIAARLRAAHRPQDMLQAAQDLHALERTLTR